MHTIEIEDSVYRYIQSQAIPFEDSCPNDTLIRLFRLQVQPQKALAKQGGDLEEIVERLIKSAPATRTKAPKTNLPKLIKQGLVSEGEPVSLVDYSGNKLATDTVKVSGGQLTYQGKRFSMSELARILLIEHGYSSQSVRGPAHWINSNGQSIKDIWNGYLRDREEGRVDG